MRTTGDSHTVALAASGAVWAWGTFRDASGVFGFSPTERVALVPALVYLPTSAAERVVKVVSGAHAARALPARHLCCFFPFEVVPHRLATHALPDHVHGKASY